MEELSKLPITDLQEDKTNPYYCKLAIERKKDNENTNFVDKGVIINALKKVSKETNARYKQKKEYNIRNGIKPWENNGR